MSVTRREILAAAAAGAFLPLTARLSLAAAGTDARLIVLILRGGLDALSAVPPHGDADYVKVRGAIAVPPPGRENGALDLDGHFGLHPELAPIHGLFADRHMLVVHAAAPPYLGRSHFDGQNILENGTETAYSVADGWLNRALLGLPDGGARLGLAVGPGVPLIMKGDAPIRTWAPTQLPPADGDFLDRLAALYQGDKLFFAALAEARRSAAGTTAMERDGLKRNPRQAFVQLANAAGSLLAQPDGPRVAVLDAGGFDTHVAQPARLEFVFGILAAGLGEIGTQLRPVWDRTAVLVVSEFGRTVAANGGGGTDHGTGGLALLMGGAVAGGRVAGDWPGLAERHLFERRDLRATTDYRGLFKGVLRDHLGIAEAYLEDRVFPESRGARPMAGLIRV